MDFFRHIVARHYLLHSRYSETCLEQKLAHTPEDARSDSREIAEVYVSSSILAGNGILFEVLAQHDS